MSRLFQIDGVGAVRQRGRDGELADLVTLKRPDRLSVRIFNNDDYISHEQPSSVADQPDDDVGRSGRWGGHLSDRQSWHSGVGGSRGFFRGLGRRGADFGTGRGLVVT